jgi:hypothetical protein
LAARRLCATRDGGQRRAHEHRRGKQAKQADERAQRDSGLAVTDGGDVELADEREQDEQQGAEDRNARFEVRVDAKRWEAGGDPARKREAPEAHPAHITREDDRERGRRGADHLSEQVEPDHFVDQGRATARDKKEQKQREIAAQVGLLVGTLAGIHVFYVRAMVRPSATAVSPARSLGTGFHFS